MHSGLSLPLDTGFTAGKGSLFKNFLPGPGSKDPGDGEPTGGAPGILDIGDGSEEHGGERGSIWGRGRRGGVSTASSVYWIDGGHTFAWNFGASCRSQTRPKVRRLNLHPLRPFCAPPEAGAKIPRK
mmetsp:Transcript_42405/g.95095  ORF Transcript_42405/g.95095 Transcript_42405/m.95095 type:complete len:127 (-) Transcript_42405:1937-2317(-)